MLVLFILAEESVEPVALVVPFSVLLLRVLDLPQPANPNATAARVEAAVIFSFFVFIVLSPRFCSFSPVGPRPSRSRADR